MSPAITYSSQDPIGLSARSGCTLLAQSVPLPQAQIPRNTLTPTCPGSPHTLRCEPWRCGASSKPVATLGAARPCRVWPFFLYTMLRPAGSGIQRQRSFPLTYAPICPFVRYLGRVVKDSHPAPALPRPFLCLDLSAL
jgi:hypothetical protein